jgi:hypothetical protein
MGVLLGTFWGMNRTVPRFYSHHVSFKGTECCCWSLQGDEMDSTETDEEFIAPPWGNLGRSATLGLVSGVSKFVLHVLNTTIFHNAEAWEAAVMRRSPGVGLLTVCNHTR